MTATTPGGPSGELESAPGTDQVVTVVEEREVTSAPAGSRLPPDSFNGSFSERRRRNPVVPIAVGVIGLAALGVAQNLPVRHDMEQDLTARTRSALDAAGLRSVSVTFTGRDGVVTGTVTSPGDHVSALALVRAQEGVRVATDHLSGPGASPSATASASGSPTASASRSPSVSPSVPAAAQAQVSAQIAGGTVRVSGRVPSQAVRLRLLGAIRSAVAPAVVVDRIVVDPSAGDAGLGRLPTVLRALGPDSLVTVQLSGGELVLAGGVPSPAARAAAKAAAAALTGDPGAVTDRLSVDPRASVSADLRRLPPLTFATAYSTLTKPDQATVRAVARILAAHPQVRVRLVGHTDDVGTVRVNDELSYARAETVYLTLRYLGIDPSRMSFNGLGEKSPTLPNTSAANRAANRWVEIRVVP